MFQTDRIDLAILDALQRNARISMTELADKVGLSASPCAERVRRMERAGVIQGYFANLSPESLGRTLLVFVEIKLASKSDDVFEQVKKALSNMPEVLEAHLVSGDYDYLVKCRLRGMSEYRHLLGKILKNLPIAAESRSLVVMEEVKETHFLPLDR